MEINLPLVQQDCNKLIADLLAKQPHRRDAIEQLNQALISMQQSATSNQHFDANLFASLWFDYIDSGQTNYYPSLVDLSYKWNIISAYKY